MRGPLSDADTTRLGNPKAVYGRSPTTRHADCYDAVMTEEQQPDAPEPIDPPTTEPAAPAPPGDGGAKLFVIFFLTLVPLIGIALVAMVIYGLLVR